MVTLSEAKIDEAEVKEDDDDKKIEDMRDEVKAALFSVVMRTR